ncbi:MAG: dihydrolipoyl dehydrogenase [Pseudomonadota bacterium]|nr:dihydrolipoyl dehydrogenase [Pseudomonadota bacterium]
MADLTCDVAVIGAGTAGIAAERNARAQGAKTLLIDPEFAGTVCATVGCMPSKLLIAAAHRAHDARTASVFGLSTTVEVDGKAVMARVRAERDRFAQATRAGFDDLPEGTCIKGRARFTSPTELVLDDGRTVSASAIVIATGSDPMVPPPYRDLGEDRLLTNRNVFEQADLPESLAVIGAGAIGVELAQAFARLGVRVAIFDQAETVAGARCDRIQAALTEELTKDLDLHLGVSPEPEAVAGGVRITWEGGAQVFERVLVATGRPPSIDGLGLEETGLTLDDQGMPKVDPETLQCGDAPIFMAGDANAARPVLHEASTEGSVAGRNAATYPALTKAERSPSFTITFTDPPLASVGEGPGGSAKIGSADYTDQGRAKVEARNVGLARIYAAAPDGRLIGADLFCPGADHMGHLIAWAVEAGMTATDLLNRPFYHPTLEEGLRGALREVCRAVPLDLPGDRDAGNPPGH